VLILIIEAIIKAGQKRIVVSVRKGNEESFSEFSVDKSAAI